MWKNCAGKLDFLPKLKGKPGKNRLGTLSGFPVSSPSSLRTERQNRSGSFSIFLVFCPCLERHNPFSLSSLPMVSKLDTPRFGRNLKNGTVNLDEWPETIDWPETICWARSDSTYVNQKLLRSDSIFSFSFFCFYVGWRRWEEILWLCFPVPKYYFSFPDWSLCLFGFSDKKNSQNLILFFTFSDAVP